MQLLRPLVTLLVAMTLVAALMSPSAAAQSPARDGAMEAGFLASLNAERAARGLAPLVLSSSMSDAAGSWTAQMVGGSFLAHASDIVSGTPSGWSKIGENVGRGKSVASLTQSFMNSPAHARNVLDPDYTMIGIAVIVHPSGRVYTTHRFAAVALASPPPAPAPPVPTAAPAPAAPEQLAFVAEEAPVLSGIALQQMVELRNWLMHLNDA